MSKDQIKKKNLSVENVDKLIMSCKMINEIRSGLKYWKLDQVWPNNLYSKTLEEVINILNEILLSSDFTKLPEKAYWPVMEKK